MLSAHQHGKVSRHILCCHPPAVLAHYGTYILSVSKCWTTAEAMLSKHTLQLSQPDAASFTPSSGSCVLAPGSLLHLSLDSVPCPEYAFLMVCSSRCP